MMIRKGKTMAEWNPTIEPAFYDSETAYCAKSECDSYSTVLDKCKLEREHAGVPHYCVHWYLKEVDRLREQVSLLQANKRCPLADTVIQAIRNREEDDD